MHPEITAMIDVLRAAKRERDTALARVHTLEAALKERISCRVPCNEVGSTGRCTKGATLEYCADRCARKVVE